MQIKVKQKLQWINNFEQSKIQICQKFKNKNRLYQLLHYTKNTSSSAEIHFRQITKNLQNIEFSKNTKDSMTSNYIRKILCKLKASSRRCFLQKKDKGKNMRNQTTFQLKNHFFPKIDLSTLAQ